MDHILEFALLSWADLLILACLLCLLSGSVVIPPSGLRVELLAVETNNSLLSLSTSTSSAWAAGMDLPFAPELPATSILHAVKRIRSNLALIPLVGSLDVQEVA